MPHSRTVTSNTTNTTIINRYEELRDTVILATIELKYKLRVCLYRTSKECGSK